MIGIMASEMFEYPAFFHAASDQSLGGQQRYMLMIGMRACSLVVAAVGGAVTWTVGTVEVLAWAALTAFVVALAIEVFIYVTAPDKIWYEGRAAAESIKTISWRFAVGGDPFPLSGSDADTTRKFLSQLQAVTDDLTYIPPPQANAGAEITQSMKSARLLPFEERRLLYRAGRIDDQISWYGSKARWNEKMRLRFLILTLGAEFAGVVAASIRVAGGINFDLLGIIAAVVAGFAAWAQTRQYGQLAQSYAIAAHELNSIRVEVDRQGSDEWSRFVDESEEAMSREHTLWRASRGVLRQRRWSR